MPTNPIVKLFSGVNVLNMRTDNERYKRFDVMSFDYTFAVMQARNISSPPLLFTTDLKTLQGTGLLLVYLKQNILIFAISARR
jgi:hypothetical protein